MANRGESVQAYGPATPRLRRQCARSRVGTALLVQAVAVLGVLCSAAGHSSLPTSLFGGQNVSHAAPATGRGGSSGDRVHILGGQGHSDHGGTMNGRHANGSVNGVFNGSASTTRR